MVETVPENIWFISDEAALADLCAVIAEAPATAIDTEFERSRTYFAELCLLQVSAGGRIACIDPLALADLAPFYAALVANPGTKILHAARQDLEVLYQAAGQLPEPIIDTQLAAALCGFAEQIGYGDLVRELLGVSLAKSATRTDWRQRPLSEEQVEYAADDVRYLAPLAESLLDRLRILGREAWLCEDCQALRNIELYAPSPDNAWQRLKGIASFAGAARARAIALAAWREREARARNLPRNWVLRDNDLLDLAARGATSVREMSRPDQANAAALRRFGPAIVEVMAHARDSVHTPADLRLNGEGRTALKALLVALQARATELGLSPAVLATRAEAEAVIAGRLSARQAGGWRRGVLADLFDPWVQRAGGGLCE